MGNKVPAQAEQTLYSDQEYSVQQTTQDPIYGDTTIIVNNVTKEQAAVITKMINNQTQFDVKIQHLSFRKELRHENIVRLLNFNVFKKEELCSSFWKISLLYEYFGFSLQKLLDVMKKQNQSLNEGDIWYLIKSCLSALLYLYSKEVNHGDVRPSSLLISNQGQIKLSENFVYSNPLTGYQQNLMELRDDLYLSPELLANLKEKVQDPPVDKQKSDVFSIGLTALEAALEKSIQVIYDKENFEIRPQVITDLLNEMSQNFSQRLVNFIAQMLSMDPEQRPGLQDQLEEIERIFTSDLLKTQISRGLPVLETIVEVADGQPQLQYGEMNYQEEAQVLSGKKSPQRLESEQQLASHSPKLISQQTEMSSNQQQQIKSSVYQLPNAKMTVQEICEQKSPVKHIIETTDYVEGNYQPVQDKDFSELDRQINQVLMMSKQTIEKYASEPQYEALLNKELPQLNSADFHTTSYLTSTNQIVTSQYTQPQSYAYQSYQTHYEVPHQTNIRLGGNELEFQKASPSKQFQEHQTLQQNYYEVRSEQQVYPQASYQTTQRPEDVLMGTQPPAYSDVTYRLAQKGPDFTETQSRVNQAYTTTSYQYQEANPEILGVRKEQLATLNNISNQNQGIQAQVNSSSISRNYQIQDPAKYMYEFSGQQTSGIPQTYQATTITKSYETAQLPGNAARQNDDQFVTRMNQILNINSQQQQQEQQQQPKGFVEMGATHTEFQKNSQVQIDRDLEEHIQRSLKRSKEIEQMIKNSQKNTHSNEKPANQGSQNPWDI